MSRRRTPSSFDLLQDILAHTPVWVGPALALVSFLLIRFLLPNMLPAHNGPLDFTTLLRGLAPLLSLLAAGLILLAWVLAEFQKFRQRRLFNTHTSLDSLRKLSWQQFEQLVAEAFRRQGYTAIVVGSSSGDGGVDILLQKDGQKTLVQCKHWQSWSVGEPVLRDLLGAVASKNATGGILVTTGTFTQPARAFAAKNPLHLIDGPALAAMIQPVSANSVIPPPTPAPASPANMPATLTCQSCNAPMILRTARKGPNPGSRFWGCARYPACRETLPFTPSAVHE